MTPAVHQPGFVARLFGAKPRGPVQFRTQSPDGGGWNYGPAASYGRDTPYTGASWIRKQLSNWFPARASADAELLGDMGALVSRSRDLDRNTGIAAGAIQTTLDNVVGSNLRLSCWPDYRALGRDPEWAEEWGRTVESLWKTFADTTAPDVANKLTFTGLTTLVFRSILQNGEALALPLWMARPESQFKTCVQLVDVDRLSNPGNMTPTLCLRGGVQMDDYGRPQAYHIRKMSNWPAMFFPAIGGIGGEWECIPAQTDWGRKRVLHVYTQDRVDQTRGKPILAPVIEQFRMLDSYQRAELQSAIVNALVAGVIETPLDPATLAEMVGGDPNAYLAAKNEYRVQLEGGSLHPACIPGDKMTPFAPDRPAPQFAAFSEFVLRQIGVSMGLPYEQLMKDYSKTNYSSARAALLESWRYFTTRRSWLTTYWAQPMYDLWFEEAVNAGLIEAPDFYNLRQFYTRAKWIGPGRGWIDPVKEAEAAQIRMASGLSTLEAECAEQGLDYNDVIDQRQIEKARLQEAGLWIEPPPPTKPTGFPANPEEVPVREQV